MIVADHPGQAADGHYLMQDHEGPQQQQEKGWPLAQCVGLSTAAFFDLTSAHTCLVDLLCLHVYMFYVF